MTPIVFSMLPELKWQIVRIIKFTYTRWARPCDATIVYYLPYLTMGNGQDKDVVDDCILKGLELSFGKLSIIKNDVIFDNTKEEIEKIYSGGRPKVHLVMRMTPEIPKERYYELEGQTFYAYDYHLSIMLDSNVNPNDIPEFFKKILITAPYPLDNKRDIEWGADAIESL